MQNGAGGADGSWRIRAKKERNTMLRQVHSEVSNLFREVPAPEMSRSKLPGDPIALRGVPTVGKGIRGEIRHTQPERETVARMSRNGR